MALVVPALIGVLAVFVTVTLVKYLASRGFFEPETSETTADERVEDGMEDEYGVPFTSRVKALTLPAKVFFGSLIALVLAVIVAGYHVMRTGSPFQQLFTTHVQMVLVGLFGMYCGIKVHRTLNSRIRHLIIQYERKGREDRVVTVPYLEDKVVYRGDNAIIHELADNRIFGLFTRHRQVGEERELRGTRKPNTDIITRMVPDHGVEVPDVGYFVRTYADEHSDGEEIDSKANSSADYKYKSPNTLSDEQAYSIEGERRRKNIENRELRNTNAELFEKVHSLRKKVDNEEYKSREDFQEDLETIMPLLTGILDASQNLQASLRTEDGENSILEGDDE